MTQRRTANRCRRNAIRAVAVVAALAAAAAAQSRRDRELEFARRLALELDFVSLAESEIDRLGGEFRDAGDQDLLAQAAIEVALRGARTKADRAERRTYFRSAIDRCRQLVERSSNAAVVRATLTALASACEDYGAFLAAESTVARSDSSERLKAIIDEADAVYRTGVDACDRVIEELEGGAEPGARGSPADKEPRRLQLSLLRLRRGVLLREHGRMLRSERAYLVERARSGLEALVLDCGEETALGQRGMLELAQCHEVLQQDDAAREGYAAVVEQLAAALRDRSLGLAADTRVFLLAMQQEAYSKLAALQLRSGDAAATAAVLQRFAAHQREFADIGRTGPPTDPRFLHLTQLIEARLQAESGDSAQLGVALQTALSIRDRHPTDLVGDKARELLADVLTNQRERIPGQVLFELARSAFNDRDYATAIALTQRALARLRAAELRTCGLEAFDLLGTAFFLTDRPLESALAFRDGIRRFGGNDAAMAQRMAERLDAAMARARGGAGDDSVLAALADEVTQLIVEAGGSKSANRVAWQQASQHLAQHDYAMAAAKLLAITPDFPMYELARARLATAQQATGDAAAAAATLAELRAFMASQPPASATASEPGRQQARAQALVEADFREANLLYQAAIGSELAKTKKDATKYPAAIAALRAFVANHQHDGGQLLLLALDNVGRLHTELGEMDKAEAAYSQLRQSDTAGADAAKLASVIFDAWLQQARNLEAEMSQAAREGRDLRARAAIAGELKVTRDRLVHLGIDYGRGSPQPQLGILIATMQTAAALADWNSVTAAGERALAVSGDTADAGQRQLVDEVVRPQQATALMQLGRFQPAYDLLRTGAQGGQNSEYNRLLARALGGWLDYDDQGQPVKIAGLGRPDQAFDLHFGAHGPRAGAERFSLAWYRFHWDAYWYALQAAGKDSRYAEHAATIYRICRSTDDFATLQQQGSDGVDLARRFRLNPPPAVNK